MTIVGSPWTYTLTVANKGPRRATGVVLTDLLSPGLAFVSGTASQGRVTRSGATVTADLGDLPAGETARVVCVVLPTAAGPVGTSASVRAAEADPDRPTTPPSWSRRPRPPRCRPRGRPGIKRIGRAG